MLAIIIQIPIPVVALQWDRKNLVKDPLTPKVEAQISIELLKTEIQSTTRS